MEKSGLGWNHCLWVCAVCQYYGTVGGLELVSLVGEQLDWTLEETCSAVRVSCSECENMTLNRTLGIEIAYPFLHTS